MDQETFKIAAALTEEEMVTLSDLLFPNWPDDDQLDMLYKTRPIWRKLIAPAEVRYKRTFDSIVVKEDPANETD